MLFVERRPKPHHLLRSLEGSIKDQLARSLCLSCKALAQFQVPAGGLLFGNRECLPVIGDVAYGTRSIIGRGE